ncbi:hypothetical protein BABINDRAFT_5926 [Babjeviella inositovora NRRL Y-12698]|uniref:Uncharacterized protein n=1 Tax=Babjeviella inositovora NRRL Y-12698 TaxID=984486 RepID=A0A1E3R0Z5_9ASCO|nr:uncharacterized protein BABINDRAFT_5926 [Babjeviella inositovora NRRL Y-12698]ODQ83057.1 hypothetical protein BABINDRAFT_5926 [Babjeviella inositovora NRRL Y-12698]
MPTPPEAGEATPLLEPPLPELPPGTPKPHPHNHKRFLLICLFGILFILGFHLTFLERTSFSRDLKRFHGDRLSFAEVQRVYLNQLSETNHARRWLEEYTRGPHLAGNIQMAEFTEEKFRKYGLDVTRKSYNVWTSHHVANHLKLVDQKGRVLEDLNLKEDTLPEDETSRRKDGIPGHHGYSASGNVTGKYIFANYCMLEDFELLLAHGIQISQRIVICRYGGIFRGLKVKNAELYGAIGVVLYSDPGDDGDMTVKNGFKPYPYGPARNPSSIQRGSVMYFTDQPGAPSNLSSPLLPKIPSLPISYEAIEPILRTLNNNSMPGWSGNLESFDYSPGPSIDTELNLYNEQSNYVDQVHNIIGKIHGIISDEEIVIGNHRDSWTTGGAGDPNSGSAIMIEIIRVYGRLLKKGWKPLRTITFASWDGEEMGMLGSTAYAEDEAAKLQGTAVCYLNLDVGVIGSYFMANGHPLLKETLVETAKKVSFNGQRISLAQYWKNQSSNGEVGLLGSGSDFTSFQHHLGIPSVDMRFANSETDAVFHDHSNYDSIHWMDTFVDPEYRYHNTMAKYLGMVAIQLSENEVTYMRTADYAAKLYEYYQSLELLHPWLTNPRDFNGFIVFSDVSKHLRQRLNDFHATATSFDAYLGDLQREVTQDYAWFHFYYKIKLAFRIKRANRILLALDKAFLYEEGLTARPWMKHAVYAPHREEGYPGDVFPGLSEALRDQDYDAAVRWMFILIGQVNAAIAILL